MGKKIWCRASAEEIEAISKRLQHVEGIFTSDSGRFVVRRALKYFADAPSDKVPRQAELPVVEAQRGRIDVSVKEETHRTLTERATERGYVTEGDYLVSAALYAPVPEKTYI